MSWNLPDLDSFRNFIQSQQDETGRTVEELNNQYILGLNEAGAANEETALDVIRSETISFKPPPRPIPLKVAEARNAASSGGADQQQPLESQGPGDSEDIAHQPTVPPWRAGKSGPGGPWHADAELQQRMPWPGDWHEQQQQQHHQPQQWWLYQEPTDDDQQQQPQQWWPHQQHSVWSASHHWWSDHGWQNWNSSATGSSSSSWREHSSGAAAASGCQWKAHDRSVSALTGASVAKLRRDRKKKTMAGQEELRVQTAIRKDQKFRKQLTVACKDDDLDVNKSPAVTPGVNERAKLVVAMKKDLR